MRPSIRSLAVLGLLVSLGCPAGSDDGGDDATTEAATTAPATDGTAGPATDGTAGPASSSGAAESGGQSCSECFQCQLDECAAELEAMCGPDFATGDCTGACAAYRACNDACNAMCGCDECSCEDPACTMDCNTGCFSEATAECQAALIGWIGCLGGPCMAVCDSPM